MSRPPSLSGDLIAVSVDGRGAAWCDGTFQGDPDIVAHATLAVRAGLSVRVGLEQEIVATNDDALGALAAILSYRPGRGIVTQAPAWILSALEGLSEEHPGHIWGDEG